MSTANAYYYYRSSHHMDQIQLHPNFHVMLKHIMDTTYGVCRFLKHLRERIFRAVLSELNYILKEFADRTSTRVSRLSLCVCFIISEPDCPFVRHISISRRYIKGVEGDKRKRG